MDNKKNEAEIKNIKVRNAKVELDNAWETSWTRRFLYLCDDLYRGAGLLFYD